MTDEDVRIIVETQENSKFFNKFFIGVYHMNDQWVNVVHEDWIDHGVAQAQKVYDSCLKQNKEDREKL